MDLAPKETHEPPGGSLSAPALVSVTKQTRGESQWAAQITVKYEF